MDFLRKLAAATGIALVMAATPALAQEPGEELIDSVTALGVPPPANTPPRGEEAQGPFRRMVITNVNVIDGTGSPAHGPVDIVIEAGRITAIEERAGTRSMIRDRPANLQADRVIDGAGGFVMPGFVNVHDHIGTPSHIYGGQLTDPDYVFKLLLAHGITTVRDVGSLMGLKWTIAQRERSAAGQITAPRIIVYALFPEKTPTPEAAVAWVRAVKRSGADGVKFLGADPEVFAAAMKEIKALKMGSAYHHSQIYVTRQDALDSARQGIDSVEHWYGLPEAMFEDRTAQAYPFDYDYNNEQDRFGEAGRLWQQAAAPGSDRWNRTIKELVDLDVTLNPTMSVYEASRDLARARTFEWLPDYAMPYMLKAFEANPRVHGSFFFDWTTANEIDWRRNFQIWMRFVNDFKNAGGRVGVGEDSGFIYSIYGFGYIRELEMLQEAGFHPLEAIRAATLNGAELLHMDDDIGTIKVGKRADLIVLGENPVANFKVLYGTGHLHYNPKTGANERTAGIRYTIRDGIVYDAAMLLRQVREQVAMRKQPATATKPAR
jgi:imidazolonepropionase-like amidohydrolase